MRTATLFLVLATLALGAPVKTGSSGLDEAVAGHDQHNSGHCDKAHPNCHDHHFRNEHATHESVNHVQVGHYDAAVDVPNGTGKTHKDHGTKHSRDEHVQRAIDTREPHRDKADRPDRHGGKSTHDRHDSHGGAGKHGLLENAVVDRHIGVGHDRHSTSGGGKGSKKTHARSPANPSERSRRARAQQGTRNRRQHDEGGDESGEDEGGHESGEDNDHDAADGGYHGVHHGGQHGEHGEEHDVEPTLMRRCSGKCEVDNYGAGLRRSHERGERGQGDVNAARSTHHPPSDHHTQPDSHRHKAGNGQSVDATLNGESIDKATGKGTVHQVRTDKHGKEHHSEHSGTHEKGKDHEEHDAHLGELAGSTKVLERSKDHQHYTVDVGDKDEADRIASTDVRAGEAKDLGQHVRSETRSASGPEYDITDAKVHAEIMGDGWRANHEQDHKNGQHSKLGEDVHRLQHARTSKDSGLHKDLKQADHVVAPFKVHLVDEKQL